MMTNFKLGKLKNFVLPTFTPDAFVNDKGQ